jgi:hypothetical protein
LNTSELVIFGGLIALIGWRLWSKRFPFSPYPPKLSRRARRAMSDIATLATAKREDGVRGPLARPGDFDFLLGAGSYAKVNRAKEYGQLRDSGRVITHAVDELLSSRRNLSDNEHQSLEFLRMLSNNLFQQAEVKLRDHRSVDKDSEYGTNELAAGFEASWNAYRNRLKRALK